MDTIINSLSALKDKENRRAIIANPRKYAQAMGLDVSSPRALTSSRVPAWAVIAVSDRVAAIAAVLTVFMSFSSLFK